MSDLYGHVARLAATTDDESEATIAAGLTERQVKALRWAGKGDIEAMDRSQARVLYHLKRRGLVRSWLADDGQRQRYDTTGLGDYILAILDGDA